MLARLIASLALLCGICSGQTVKVRLARQGVVAVPMEEYVAWVLAGEAGGMKSPDALKAMAITIRSYARVNRGRHRAEGFDYCETTHCQDARPHAVTERLREAAWDTEGVVLWYRGRPAMVFYTGHCGGRTAAAGEIWPRAARPYLPSVEDSYCLSAGRQAWSAKLAWADLAAVLSLPMLHSIDITQRTLSGRAWKLSSDAGPIDAERLHLAVGRGKGWNLLRSRSYDVQATPTHAIFSGSGTGHGAGLCQIGAEQRGKAGQRWQEILQAYFPGTRPGVTAQDIPWVIQSAERVEIWSTGAASDAQIPSAAQRALAEAERLTGLKIAKRPRVKVYPTVALFRDATGEPGTTAAITRGRHIHLQPAAKLAAAGWLESTLLHEMIHAVIALNARSALPAWFDEGLADLLGQGKTHPQQRLRVEKLVKAKGLPAVLGMIRTGVVE